MYIIHVKQSGTKVRLVRDRQNNIIFIIFSSDSDECSEGTDDCVENAQCVDTVEGFDCVCLPGFTGNGKTLCEGMFFSC